MDFMRLLWELHEVFFPLWEISVVLMLTKTSHIVYKIDSPFYVNFATVIEQRLWKPRFFLIYWVCRNVENSCFFLFSKEIKIHSHEKIARLVNVNVGRQRGHCFYVSSNWGVHAHSCIMGNLGKMVGNSKICIEIQSQLILPEFIYLMLSLWKE